MVADTARRDLTRCAFVGDELLVAQCADIARAHGLTVVVVATTNALVREEAGRHGVPVFAPCELDRALVEHPAEVLFSIANLRIVAADVLARVGTAINFHDGPLPAYAGLNVTTWALLAGEREHAVTWHVMTDRVDAGDVVAVERFPIDAEETAFSLNARCYEAALASFPRVAAAVATGSLAGQPQPGGERHMFGRHDRPARLFDPTSTAVEQVRVVRALDLGHRLRNPVGSVRLVANGSMLVVERASVATEPSRAPAGSIVAADSTGLRIATSDGDVVIKACCTPGGTELDPPAALDHLGLAVGDVLAAPEPRLVTAIAEHEPILARDETFWIERAVVVVPDALPWESDAAADPASASIDLADADDAAAMAAVAVWQCRLSATHSATFAATTSATRAVLAKTAPLTRAPYATIDVERSATFADIVSVASGELTTLRRRAPLLADALSRDPRSRGADAAPRMLVELDADGGFDRVAAAAQAIAAGALVHVALGDGRLTVSVPRDSVLPERVAEQLATILRAGRAAPTALVIDLPTIGPAEAARLAAINATRRDHDRTATIDSLFRARAAAAGDQPAISFAGRTLSYGDLEEAVGVLGQRLAAAGIGRGDRVGIAVPRGVEMVVGVLATLELGAAYVPLDPSYPRERLQLVLADAGISALVTTGATAGELARPGVTLVDPFEVTAPVPPGPRRAGGHEADELAYVIYTSGSTGVPKGVMVEHRQVTNFFAAMDDLVAMDSPGVWLAVTSLSFDISVLELLWTLTRGFHVVIKPDSELQSPAVTAPRAESRRPVSFSLFYFAAGENTAADGYRLLLESARFADRHDFEAVWTPERHFHAFGGAYPNPSVTGAALAAVTSNVAIRAGSVVLPLHSPIRVAEEWSVVDNLSRGRVGISFAAGWQPDDFVLNPSAFADAKEQLPQSIDTVRKLWRGESVVMPGHDGEPVEVRTLPRPVQADLPTWLTSAGSPSTFERAGTLGVNLLTHLLGQSVEQLASNIARYRAAWAEAGHPGEGHVTLMMHTYLDVDADTAREVAREPMKGYLGTAVGLVRDVASAFPTFAGRGTNTDDLFKSLAADELEQLLDVAAERYLGTSGLFGTAADAAATVDMVAEVGVDEVACLIDFGVATDQVLASLELLLDAKRLVDTRRANRGAPVHVVGSGEETIGALVDRHGVTHLQCTPSLAAMILADPADAAGLRKLRHLLVGGEALPLTLAADLRTSLSGRLTNMYGPTETTIWSLVHEIADVPAQQVPIGRPIANTTVFVLDGNGRPVPAGVLGELHIGGDGVARGYHDRDELTAERFVERPGMGRTYATGDLVRIHPAGHLEFAGRIDDQVKIRGHRIELGEIEAVLDRHHDVARSVVVARGEATNAHLVGFVLPRGGRRVSGDALRKHVAAALPDVMVPSVIASLDAIPLTPNGKVDRNRLPVELSLAADDGHRAAGPPVDDVERLVAEIWESELKRPVGRDDNFFDIGGHSLLAVKVFRRLGDSTSTALALTDVFRYPTVRSFAAHLSAVSHTDSLASSADTPPGSVGSDRGAMRRRALARRAGSAEIAAR